MKPLQVRVCVYGGGGGGALPKWEIQFASDKSRFVPHTSSEEGSLHQLNISVLVFSALNCLAFLLLLLFL